MRPFAIAIKRATVDDLAARLAEKRWPDQIVDR